VFTNDDSLNAEDPLGLHCFSWRCVGRDLLVNVEAAGSAIAIVGTTVGTGVIDDEGQGLEADDVILKWYDDEFDDTSCDGQSFTPTTAVQLADGTNVPISELKIGEMVLAVNVKTGKQEADSVAHIWVKQDFDLMDVTVKTPNGMQIIDTTQHHLFWDLTTKTWTRADQLESGDQLETSSGLLASVVSEIVVPGSAEMWDITVSNDHDFYVTPDAGGAAALLVHNCPSYKYDKSDDGLGDDAPSSFEKMPQGDNTAANRVAEYAAKSEGLGREEEEALHDEITNQGLDKSDILKVARQIRNKELY
jgi:hypothetical protein